MHKKNGRRYVHRPILSHNLSYVKYVMKLLRLRAENKRLQMELEIRKNGLNRPGN